jgi:glycosyltransferase involved in cell wall biosynthesis
MRVGLVIYGDLGTISGGYLYDRKLVSYLESQGDQVDIFSLPYRNYYFNLFENLSNRLYRRTTARPLDILLQDELNHPSLFMFNRRLLRWREKEKRIPTPPEEDAIHSAAFPIISIVHHLRSSEKFHSLQLKLIRSIERRYLKSVDGFIFNSEQTRRDVLSLSARTDNFPAVIAHPAGDNLNPKITEKRIVARSKKPGPIRVVFLGNLIPRKGVDVLLRAVACIPEGLVRVEIIGDDKIDPVYTRKVRRLFKNSLPSEAVRFHNSLDDKDLAFLLGECHIMAIPSEYEGFGISYLEGMGFGLPAIGTTAGGTAEIINHGENGYLVEPGDVDGLCISIMEFSHDRDRLLEMSLAARAAFLEHPTWDQTCQKIRNFLLENASTW